MNILIDNKSGAPKNVEFLREKHRGQIEEHVEQIARLAAFCNLSKEEILDMVRFGLEGKE